MKKSTKLTLKLKKNMKTRKKTKMKSNLYHPLWQAPKPVSLRSVPTHLWFLKPPSHQNCQKHQPSPKKVTQERRINKSIKLTNGSTTAKTTSAPTKRNDFCWLLINSIHIGGLSV